MQPPPKETCFELPVVSPPDPRLRLLTNSFPDYDYAEYERKISMCFDAENQI